MIKPVQLFNFALVASLAVFVVGLSLVLRGGFADLAMQMTTYSAWAALASYLGKKLYLRFKGKKA